VGVSQPRREVGYSPPSSLEVKKQWNSVLSFSVWLLRVDRATLLWRCDCQTLHSAGMWATAAARYGCVDCLYGPKKKCRGI